MTPQERAAALERREVIVEGKIDDEQATMLIAVLLYLDDADPSSPITIRVDSPGGVVTSSLAIIDAISSLRAPVFTHAEGAAEGTAALIVAWGRKGHRTATPTSRFLLCPSRTLQPSDSVIDAQEVTRINLVLAEMLAQVTGVAAEAMHKDMMACRRFLGTEALDLGLIDSVVVRRSPRWFTDWFLRTWRFFMRRG